LRPISASMLQKLNIRRVLSKGAAVAAELPRGRQRLDSQPSIRRMPL
jgi:hypothetical protein